MIFLPPFFLEAIYELITKWETYCMGNSAMKRYAKNRLLLSCFGSWLRKTRSGVKQQPQ